MIVVLAFNALVLLAALGSLLSGGIMFIFSNTIMRSLADMPDHHGAHAMVVINRKIINPLFFAVFIGPALLSIAILGFVFTSSIDDPDGYLRIAGFTYLIGMGVVTAARNVPMNDKLDDLDWDPESQKVYWAEYLKKWTSWNHIRTVAGIISGVLYFLAI